MSQESIQHLKVVFVGDAAVGKSSLIERLAHDRFTPEIVTTIGMEMDEKIYALSPAESIVLHLFDIAAPRLFKPQYYRDAALLCIVINATHDASHPESKIKQIERYCREFGDSIQSNKRWIIVIENKSDLPNAVRLADNELAAIERLGIERQNYMYASAKIGQTSQGKSIEGCFFEFAQAYIAANFRERQQQVKLSVEMPVSIPSAAPPSLMAPSFTMFSLSWWLNLISSSAETTFQFENADEIRAQIDKLSNEQAINILQATHKHLVKGNASDQHSPPFQLSLGGGSEYVAFMDRNTHKVVTCVNNHFYPQNVIRWLSVCLPYVLYRKNISAAYVNNAKYALLVLFNDILKTVGNMRSSWLRYPSTTNFYKALPTFFHPACVTENKSPGDNSANLVKHSI